MFTTINYLNMMEIKYFKIILVKYVMNTKHDASEIVRISSIYPKK